MTTREIEKLFSTGLHYEAIARHTKDETLKVEATAKANCVRDLISDMQALTRFNLVGGYRVEMVNFVMTSNAKKYYDSLGLEKQDEMG